MTKVSVILPAYQVEATLRATLRSVLAQTHRDLEIFVVDDGSTDATRMIGECMAALDRRIIVLGQTNAGVAAARNHAIDQASGEFIAPIDADDIWHPRKIELQLERFEHGGPGLGLVYNWFRAIDAGGRVLPVSAGPPIEGMCLHRHLAYNFIANGSTPLIRRRALGDLRYDPHLAAAGDGGCEDYLLQLQVSTSWEFGLVPAWLTGYRKAGPSMSSDFARMVRSHVAVLRLMQKLVGPSGDGVIRRRIARLQVEYLRNRLARRCWGEAFAAFGQALTLRPLRLPRNILEELVAELRRAFPPQPAYPFDDYPPDLADGRWPYKLAGWMAELERLDQRLSAAARR